MYIGVSEAIYFCCTCYIAITAQPRLCKDKLSQQKHLQPVYTLYSNHCVSTVAYANRAFRFLAIQVLRLFGESLGIHFGRLFVIFHRSWVPEWETGSRSLFLVIQGWKGCQIAEAACAITLLKPNVFVWFHFFYPKLSF